MLSDRGIKDAVSKERLIIEPFEPGVPEGSDTPNLGTCSYNLKIERIYRIGKFASSADIPAYDGMEEFIDKYCEPYPGYFIEDNEYLGVTRERVASVYDPVVTDRSSAARIGLEIMDANPGRWDFLGRQRMKPGRYTC